MKIKFILTFLFIFNLIIGNYLLFVTEGKKETLFNASLLHLCFSLSSILFLVFLINQFRKRGSYILLFFLSLCLTFLIPVIGTFIFGTTISIMGGDFKFIIAVIVLSLGAGIASIPFWGVMGPVNFVILVFFKKQLIITNNR